MDGFAYGFIRVLSAVVVFGSILFLVFVTTKYVGGRANRAMRGKYITIVESISLGMDKQIHLLRVGEQFVLIGSAGKNIEFLTNIRLDGYEEISAVKEHSPFDFKNMFEKYIQAYKSKKDGKKGSERNDHHGLDDQEGDVFRKNLSKLRNLNQRYEMQAKEDGDENTYEK